MTPCWLRSQWAWRFTYSDALLMVMGIKPITTIGGIVLVLSQNGTMVYPNR